MLFRTVSRWSYIKSILYNNIPPYNIQLKCIIFYCFFVLSPKCKYQNIVDLNRAKIQLTRLNLLMVYFAYVCLIWLSRVLTCMLSNKFLLRYDLQEMPSQDFIRCLKKDSRFRADLKWDGRLFQIFGS